MDFIFMLTRNDKTVSDCLHVIDLIEPLGLRHIGLKDVGVTEASVGELVNRIKARGATSCMEVVSITPQAAAWSIRTAAKIGVDRVLGGQEIETAMQVLHATGTGYYPFAGRPAGHPTKLAGSPDCRGLSSRSRYRLFGCRSARLPAFTGTDPGARGAGADAFTIGSSAPALMFLAQDVRQHRLALRVEAVRAMPRNSAG